MWLAGQTLDGWWDNVMKRTVEVDWARAYLVDVEEMEDSCKPYIYLDQLKSYLLDIVVHRWKLIMYQNSDTSTTDYRNVHYHAPSSNEERCILI